MTRPMPGPPEYWWYCTPPHGEPGLWTSDMDPAEYMPFTHLQHKRLTDTECADELESTFTDFLRALPCISDMLRARERLRTWERFAARPHAFDAT